MAKIISSFPWMESGNVLCQETGLNLLAKTHGPPKCKRSSWSMLLQSEKAIDLL